MKKACVILANGCEEVEAITPIDYLRRAGVEVVAAGLDGREAVGAHGLIIGADAVLDDIDDEEFDCIVVPGGKMEMAIQLVATPLIRSIMERRKNARRADGPD